MFSVWRITKARYADAAFDGEGARLYGGRWNRPGTSVIYTAGSRSLAVLEMLVHLDSPDLLQKYVLMSVDVEESFVMELDTATLPQSWTDDPPPSDVQAIGDAWVRNARSAVLRVPSAIVPGEFNFLLTPNHPDFNRLRIGEPTPFLFDSRLSRHSKRG